MSHFYMWRVLGYNIRSCQRCRVLCESVVPKLYALSLNQNLTEYVLGVEGCMTIDSGYF